MSKGLDAFQKVKKFHEIWDFEDIEISGSDYFTGEYEQEEELDIIEQELKDYQEIKEMAKYYNFSDLGNDVYKIQTDRKWQLKFDAGICSIQEDYRKARAFDIIKNKRVDMEELFESFKDGLGLSYYNSEYCDYSLTQEEWNLLKEELL